MAVSVANRPLNERALEVLRRGGNPFRNYFARNPDDIVCSRYHVPELFAHERDQLLGVVDLYRYDAGTHSEIVPILGNKGAGKTHLLYSIKHGDGGTWQLLVTPGTYHKDTDFLEYLLFQIIDTLLGGNKQKGNRPIEVVGESLCRRHLETALGHLSVGQQLELFPVPGLGRWTRRLGLGSSQAQERTKWLIDQLNQVGIHGNHPPQPLRRLCAEAGVDEERAYKLVANYVEGTESRGTAGLMRRHIYQGFARAALMGDETDLANFLTFGFAELEFQVRPTRQDLVLSLFKVLMEVFLGLKIPVVVAFDQLEDLLLARRTQDGHRIAEAFFAGIVQAMHQIEGVCFLIFAERGLWNRFVPSLDGYIQDRLNNPVHVPRYGTIKTLRLESPSPELVRRIVEARLRPVLEELPDFGNLPTIFPFTEEQILRVARTEPTLRDMLQQFRHGFDRVVYGASTSSEELNASEKTEGLPSAPRLQEDDLVSIKSVIVVETPANGLKQENRLRDKLEGASNERSKDTHTDLPASVSRAHTKNPRQNTFEESWVEEINAARIQLEPEGALTGATRELQSGLGKFLQVCYEHGVKVGPWRLSHVVSEFNFGEHPTYGVLTIAHWVCKDGQPWKVGVGLFLGRGPGKPKDLEIKLATMEADPPVVDHLILLRPEDDLVLSGKSKALWQETERRGRHARLEPVSLVGFSILYGFPRWLTAATEALPVGQTLPNLADFLQDKCEKVLQQVCMPVHQ